jgi:basic membrane protein A and related proteins
LDSRPAGTPDNFGVWSTKDDDGAYILGMMLAAASKTDLLGFVASFPFPGILTEANGLLLGARAINPNMKLRIIYVSSFYDPAKETVAAKALIAAGAGGLFTTNNDPATGVAAEAAGVPFVSFDLFNGQKFAPKEYLNSVYFDNTQMEKQFVTNTLSGKPNPQDFVLNGFADGSLTLGKPGPAYQRLVSAANRAKIATALGRLKSGALNPYTGPLKDQKGKVVVPPGKRLSARESISTPWLLEGITSSG